MFITAQHGLILHTLVSCHYNQGIPPKSGVFSSPNLTEKLCFSLAEWSETDRKKREALSLSAEVSCYHSEVWGAAVCCTFLFARFAKVPHSLSWMASLGRPTHPPFELLKKQKSHADKPFLCSLWFPDT